MIFYTADLHFGHANILKYCNRPFQNVEEMDEQLIKNWNSVISAKGDTVYILGDFSFYKDQQKTINVLNRLNGSEKHLILGNHDVHMKAWVKEKFTSCEYYKEIYIPDTEGYGGKQFVVLMHYAMKVFNKCHHGAIQLFGHSHGTILGNSQQLDVGVDCWNYTPVSYTQIKEKLSTLPLYKQNIENEIGKL